jgi:UDP-3-O-[3-hydroxymyristoyl] glucosamine N-acyltransferase
MKLLELADALGRPAEGDPELEIVGLAGLDDAGAGELTFVTGERYRGAFEKSSASAFLLPDGFDASGRHCLRSPAPYVDFARAIDLLYPEPPCAAGVHPTAVVADSARLAEGVSVGAYVVIGEGVQIGARTRIHPHVTIYAGCTVGRDCEIHSGAHLRARVRLADRVVVQNGAVIGSDGFGFAFTPDGTRLRVPHRVGVEIDDDAEIGANTTIDASHPGHPRRGAADSATRIGRGVKIDNQVQVAHGCEVAEGATVCAQVGLAGRTRVGRNVFFAGGACTSGDLEVGDGAAVLGMSGVMSDVEPGAQVVGIPAQPRRTFFRMIAASKQLAALLRRVSRLERAAGLSDGE